MPREFSAEAHEFVENWTSGIDTRALMVAFEAGALSPLAGKLRRESAADRGRHASR
jgi:hypothetical protein